MTASAFPRFGWRALLLALALLSPGCEKGNSAPAREAGTVRVRVGAETFTLEVADTPKAQHLGLMHRKTMPADRGMLFVFADEDERSFWMKNTYIPLDIIYLDAAGKVVSVKQMKPLDERSVPSDGPAKYAIELNQGAGARAGVKPGMMIEIPPEARDPRGL